MISPCVTHEVLTSPEQRASEYLHAAAIEAVRWYNDSGDWVTMESRSPGGRERLWVCAIFYQTGHALLADAIIRTTKILTPDSHRFNVFETNIAVTLLVHFSSRMADDVREKLQAITLEGFKFKPGNRQPDYQFHGYNDNFPAMATLGLLLGGEMLGHAEAVDYGLWNLRQLRAQLVRCGINSEYNSPTYSPLTLHMMAMMACHAKNAEARELALGCEQRLWIDMASRFHPETGVLAGPYSRAYTVNTVAHTGLMSMLLWLVLGDSFYHSPMRLFDPDPEMVVAHENDYPYAIAINGWFTLGEYHLPEVARKLFAEKPYPFHATATAEMGETGQSFPSRSCRLETYMEKDFSVGTADTAFIDGRQSRNYFVTYRRKAPVTSYQDTGTIYHATLVNDQWPGQIVSHEPYKNRGEQCYWRSADHSVVLQKEGSVLLLSTPHPYISGQTVRWWDNDPQPAVSTLTEAVVFPSHFGGADELMVGGKARYGWSGTADKGEWICCRRGQLLIGIRPLAYHQTGDPIQITLEEKGKYQYICVKFYEGENKYFTFEELMQMHGGFVAEHASVESFSSLLEFHQFVSKASFTDYYWLDRRVRYQRPQGDSHAPLEMEMAWTPGSITQRFATLNGKPPKGAPIEIDTLKEDDFPFLQDPFKPTPRFWPWKKLEVAWGDWPQMANDF